MDNSNLNIKTVNVCRTCMKEIINSSFFHLDFTQIDSEPTIGQKLSNCIPELDLSIVPNTVICSKCADTINSLHLFKKECLKLEMQIREYIQQAHHSDNVIDLAAVMQFHQLHSKNLTAELTTEAFEKTENYKIEESTTSFCDNYPFNKAENTTTGVFKKTENYKNEESKTSFYDYYVFNETERYTEIANKEYFASLEKVDRQCVLFNTFENYTNFGKSEPEENSDTHDSNIVQDCILQVDENPDSCIQDLNKVDIYYQCFTCGHRAESKLKLIRHLKIHTDTKLYRKKNSLRIHKGLLCWYRCDLCNYSIKHKCLFSYHNRAHLTKKDYLCILKSRPILVNRSTNTITFGKKDSKIKCRSFSASKHNFKYWGKSLSKYSESRQHSTQCNISKLGIDTNIIEKNRLQSHMLTHTDEKPFKCTFCEYSCTRESNLKSHILTHTGEKPFKCSICEYGFNKKGNLKCHMLIHTGENSFKCSVCEYSCNKKQNLKRHMLTHTGERSFKCSVCEYSFKQKHHLKRHMLTHTGEKPFKCTVCEYSCSLKSNLKSHILIHAGEKPFKCSVCEYGFNKKGNLKCHMLIHTGEKPFKCSVCEYGCRQNNHLQIHMLTHTGEKPLKCSLCEFSCNHNSSLKRHILTHSVRTDNPC